MVRLAWLVLTIATLALADEDPTDVLVRLRDQVTDHRQHIPNHTCVETIVRDRFRPVGTVPKSCDALLARRRKAGPGANLKATSMDRFRLEVAVAEGGEIYSWPGAGAFVSGEAALTELIHEGPMGTGNFASLLLEVFRSSAAHFFYEGNTEEKGRQLMRFSFQVPRESSEYRVRAGQNWLVTSYTGTLLVEPRAATLVRITIRTDELPVDTSVCEADTTLEYSNVQIGALGYLLPAMARQRFIGHDGLEEENRTTFASCQESAGEPAVTPSEKTRKDQLAEASRFPAGMPVTVELTSSIALDQAAAGDPIEGRLAFPILDGRSGPVLAPAGAVARGRLMRVETRYSIPLQLTAVLRWETVEIDGVRTPIPLKPVRSSSGQPRWNVSGTLIRTTEIETTRDDETRYATLHFHGNHPELKSGLRSDWLTADPE